MTHKELIEKGAKFLKNSKSWRFRCQYVVKDFVSMCYETPDVFGIRGSRNILIEVKTSKTDFKKDQKKRFRREPSEGIGYTRYYLCPENLITIEELPDKWGLLYCNTKNKIEVIKESEVFNERNIYGEMNIMYSIIRRLALKPQILEFGEK